MTIHGVHRDPARSVVAYLDGYRWGWRWHETRCPRKPEITLDGRGSHLSGLQPQGRANVSRRQEDRLRTVIATEPEVLWWLLDADPRPGDCGLPQLRGNPLPCTRLSRCVRNRRGSAGRSDGSESCAESCAAVIGVRAIVISPSHRSILPSATDARWQKRHKYSEFPKSPTETPPAQGG